MKRNKTTKLAINRETLRYLTRNQIRPVAGASGALGCTGTTNKTVLCGSGALGCTGTTNKTVLCSNDDYGGKSTGGLDSEKCGDKESLVVCPTASRPGK